MDGKRIVSIILGLTLLILALMAYLMGSIDPSTNEGLVSLLAAILLGMMVLGSGLAPRKEGEISNLTSTGAEGSGDASSSELGVIPEDMEPDADPAGSHAGNGGGMAPHGGGLSKRGSFIVAMVVIVVAVLVVLSFEGYLFDDGEEWSGNCTYYYLDIYGERDSLITGTCTLTYDRNGDSVTGMIDIYPEHQTDIGPSGYLPAVEEHIELTGVWNDNVITLYSESYFSFNEYEELWIFTIDDGVMSGTVTNLDTYAYLGLDSDPGGFVLT